MTETEKKYISLLARVISELGHIKHHLTGYIEGPEDVTVFARKRGYDLLDDLIKDLNNEEENIFRPKR